MNNDFMERALQQAKDLQKKITDAAAKGQEQLQPHLDDAIKQAKAMGATLGDRAHESAGVTNAQASQALDRVQDALKAGSEAAKAGAVAAAPHLKGLLDAAKTAVGDFTKSLEKR